MALRKFGPNDIVLNTMRTNPQVEYLIYDGNVYYNNNAYQSGALTDNILEITGGAVSLYEFNIDRPVTDGTDPITGLAKAVGPVPDEGRIRPWIFKGSARSSFKTTANFKAGESFINEFAYGDVLTGTYPLGGRIEREIMWNPGEMMVGTDLTTWDGPGDCPANQCSKYATRPLYEHFYALKNRLNYYGYMSEHYKVASSYGDGWDKAVDKLNLISVPAIMYGSTIRRGSVSLKYYYTGSLLAELQDTKQNGELIETIGDNAGKVGGVVMYDEGFLILTGSWRIPGTPSTLYVGVSGSTSTRIDDYPRWIYFAAGAYDGNNSTTSSPPDAGQKMFANNAFKINFQAQTDIQVYTMFAHAPRGQVNFSTNPTFIEFGQSAVINTSSAVYEENPTRTIKNTVSSSYLDYNAPFKKQVFISRVGIYDDSKNLIGIATLADPVLKEEHQDYTFKIKLDI